MRCGTRLTSTWMVAGEIGELSWGTERSCSWLLHILHGLPAACDEGQRLVLSTWSLAGLTGEALVAAGPPITGLSLRVAVLQLLQSWGCGADLFSFTESGSHTQAHKAVGTSTLLCGSAFNICNVHLPTVQGTGANIKIFWHCAATIC